MQNMPPQNINKLSGSFAAPSEPNCPIRPIGNASSPGIHLAAFLAFCQYPAHRKKPSPNRTKIRRNAQRRKIPAKPGGKSQAPLLKSHMPFA